ncbi:DNA repair protein XRCC3 isoform X2 [Phascolarctos cinereus]|uniref:DNA repair protein XRCC3 isoform X2 n=1 Tax=Phascolarctos cinereus TaxID=38626 RepID=A0A6P5IXD4_PHACI|nr:DNA repair protein XRCC3 isoform X2 [Phascolarctos cinereus]
MDWDQLELNPKVITAIKKAKLKSIKEVLHLSGPDLQRLTKLSSIDVQHLLKTVSLALRNNCVLTGVIYICTEDVFPDKRLQQLIALQHELRTDVPGEIIKKIKFGNSIFIEHAADIETLFECITKRAPILLSRGMVRLIIIDSIAALFRCEFGIQHSITKAKYLQSLGAKLHQLSNGFQSPVLCINQITYTVDERGLAGTNMDVLERVSPALGITWSNQLLMRLMVSRSSCEFSRDTDASATGTVVRTLSVIFAPHLPQSYCHYMVNAEGVKGAE